MGLIFLIKEKSMKANGWKKIGFTILTAMILSFFIAQITKICVVVYGSVEGPVQGAIAVTQLNGGAFETATTQAVSSGIPILLINYLGIGVILALWIAVSICVVRIVQNNKMFKNIDPIGR
jgi:hypothetical protein